MTVFRSAIFDIFPYSRFVYKYPVFVVVLSFLIFTALPGVILYFNGIRLNENPEKGFDTRQTKYSGPRLAWEQIQGPLMVGNRVTFPYDFPLNQTFANLSLTTADTTIKRSKRNWADSLLSSFANVACYENPIPAMDYLSQFVIELPSIDAIFDSSVLMDMCKLHEQLRDQINFFDQITPYRNIFHVANYFSCISPNFRVNCSYIEEKDIRYAKELLQFCLPHRSKIIGCRKHCHKFGNQLTIEPCKGCDSDQLPANCSTQMVFDLLYRVLPKNLYERPVYINNYLPLFSYTAYKLQGMPIDIKQYINLEEKMIQIFSQSKTLKLKGLNFEVKRDLMLPYAIQDSELAIIAAVSVLIIIAIYSFSILYTLSIVFMLGSSVLSALAIYSFFTPDFPLLNLVVFVLLISLGSDDAFLVHSAFEEPDKFDEYTFHETLKHVGSTMFLIQFSTVIPFFINVASNVIVFRDFGLFAGFTLTANYFMLISFLPAFVVIQKKYTNNICSFKKPITFPALTKAKNYFINEILPSIIIQGRFVWLFTLTSYTAISAFIIITQLTLPQYNPLQLFAKSNLHEWFDNNAEIQFDFIETKLALPLNMRLIWGLNEVAALSYFKPELVSNVSIDRSFRLNTLGELKALSSELSRIRHLDFVNHEAKFWPERFLDWSKKLNCTADTACCNYQNKFFEDDFLDYCLRISTSQLMTMFNDTPIYHNYTFELVGYTALMPTQLKYSHKFRQLSGAFDRFDAELKPKVSTNSFWYTPEWGLMSTWIDLQKAIVSDCQYSVYISFFVVALFAFACLKLKAIPALFCMSFIVISTGGTVIFFEWELGVLEAVILVLVVGLSFDYTLHYGAALPSNGCPYHKLSQVIQTATFPVALAAFTSLLAGLIMLFSRTHAFFQVGMFLVVSITASWVFSTFFFLSLIYVTLEETDDCRKCKKKNNKTFGEMKTFAKF
uniref:SSD domain-containing protein n=1 Tax=Rhabditophanes sp. KR3021 TaxID=114890 RepID=A0AC35TP43_9BILA